MRLLGSIKDYLKANISNEFAIGAIYALTVIILATIVPSVVTQLVNPVLLDSGAVAPFTIHSPRDFYLTDNEVTAQRRAEAAAEIKRVFFQEQVGLAELQAKLAELYRSFDELARSTPANGPRPNAAADQRRVNQDMRSVFERRFGIDFEGEQWNVLEDPELREKLAEQAVSIVEPFLRRGVIANKKLITGEIESNRNVVLRQSGDLSEREIASAAVIYDLEEATEAALAIVGVKYPVESDSRGHFLGKLVRYLLRPNVVYEMEETERRREQAQRAIETTYYLIERGEVIVEAGQVVTREQARKLEQLGAESERRAAFQAWIGYLVLSAIVLLFVYLFVTLFWQDYRLRPRDVGLVACSLIGSFLLLKFFSAVAVARGNALIYFDPGTFVLATPLATAGIMLQVTLGAPGTFLFFMSFALLTGAFLTNSWLLIMLIVIGNIVGAISVRNCSRRSAFIWAGLRVAAVNVLLVMCFMLFNPEFGIGEVAQRVVWAVIGGVSAGVLATGLTPIAETFGRYVTDIRLLELASLDHPLLRELSIQAPGTWNHSMVIGQMGESAAEAIGANPLLTRVGAYYHDIGKSKKPAYFVENQTGENRHDKLTPSMSALIIKKHVKEGVEMAEKHGLPRTIIDFIPQHHGTSLISYFYEKAQKEAEAEDSVEESHYRYSGPKPQSKEAGILMLADVVEASSRTLSDPSPAKIQGLVQKLINKVFASGELDESNLTLKDLHLIAKSFTRVLTGIYHRRVEYSEPVEKGKEARTAPASAPAAGNGQAKDGRAAAGPETTITSGRKDGSRNLAEPGGDKNTAGEQAAKEPAQANGKETLKRLGM